MKVFVLTDCAAEQNYTPHVFTTREAARVALKRAVEDCIGATIGDGEVLTYDEAMDCYIFSYEVYDDRAEIVYTDDTYDVFQIFEVEVE